MVDSLTMSFCVLVHLYVINLFLALIRGFDINALSGELPKELGLLTDLRGL